MADKIDQILTQIFSTCCFQILLNEQIDEFWVDLNLTQQENRNAIVSNPGYSPVQFALLRVIQLMQEGLQRQRIQGVSKSQADDIATREFHKILDGSLRHFTFNFVFHVNKGNEEPKTTPEVLRYLRSHGGSDLREKSHVIDLFLEDYYGAPPDLRHKKEPPFNDFFWRPGVEVSNAAAKKRKTRAESSSACPFEQVWQLLVLNEDISKHVFLRDFVPSGLARLMKNDPDGQSVKTSLLQTLRSQGWGTAIDDFTHVRAEPVDSALWWIVLLRSYTEGTGDRTFKENLEVQKALKLILHRYLSVSLDTFPTLLCADGCCMIDSRMGIHGYPIEIQALFYFALRCARGLLEQERHAKELLEQIDKRLTDLRFHIQNYYWLDVAQLNNMYRYKTKEYSSTAAGKFNVVPDSIPAWVFDFMPLRGGYFIGNVSTGRMDFRWFLVGNCIAILSSLATTEQATAIMDLIEEHWEVLIGEMPLKIAYPALEGHEWRVITGSDPKNTTWSYHNGGSWPTLLWLFTAACIKASRLEMAKRAIEQAEQRMSKDNWPEYYDGKVGRYVGKEARKLVPRTIAGYLVAKLMMENPATLHLVSLQN